MADKGPPFHNVKESIKGSLKMEEEGELENGTKAPAQKNDLEVRPMAVAAVRLRMECQVLVSPQINVPI